MAGFYAALTGLTPTIQWPGLSPPHTDTAAGSRTYAAYGGLYIIGSMAWMWLVEDLRPDRWDVMGGAICLVGAAVILGGPR